MERKGIDGRGVYKYNLDDEMFWNGPVWQSDINFYKIAYSYLDTSIEVRKLAIKLVPTNSYFRGIRRTEKLGAFVDSKLYDFDIFSPWQMMFADTIPNSYAKNCDAMLCAQEKSYFDRINQESKPPRFFIMFSKIKGHVFLAQLRFETQHNEFDSGPKSWGQIVEVLFFIKKDSTIIEKAIPKAFSIN